LEITAGKTLLVDGPAAVKIISGQASIFGCRLKQGKTYVMRPWRRYPIYIETDSRLEITLGADAKTLTVEEGSTVQGWREIVEKTGPGKVIAVCGRTDSGKTSLTTFAANYLVEKYGKCVVVSLDPGQCYFTSPTVVGAAFMNEPVHDLVNLKPFHQIPVGSPSAAACATRIAEAAEELNQILPDDAHVVIDVDGWVDGALAISHKQLLLKTMNVSAAVVLGENTEELVNALEQANVLVVKAQPSDYVKHRDLAERKKTREWLYRKSLGELTLKHVPASWVRLEAVCREIDPHTLYRNAAAAILEAFNIKMDETLDAEIIMSKKRCGVICYLYDSSNRYKGLGIFLGMNKEKNFVKLLTKVESEIAKIRLGRLVLSEEGDEIVQLD